MSLLKKLTLAASIAGLVACGADDDSDAYVRILHASPDAPAVDVYVNGELQLSDVAYQDGTGYMKVSDGNANIELRVAGTDTVAASLAESLSSDTYYAAVAVNEVASLDIAIIEETDTVTDDDVDVRVLHAAPGASSVNVDVYVTDVDAELGASASVDALSYLSDQVLNDVTEGNYQVRLTADGSTDVIYDSGSVNVAEDALIVAVNSEKGRSPVSLLVWAGPSATAVLDNTSELRIVHALDSQDVDIYTNAELYLEDVSYKDETGYLVVPAGSLPVSVTAANVALSDDTTLASSALNLERGESYTVVASGSSDDTDNARLIFVTDQRVAEDAELGYVRLIHASTDTNAANAQVLIYTGTYEDIEDPSAEEDFTFQGFSQGDDTDYIERAPETYEIDMTATGTTTPDLVTGLDATAVAAGDLHTIVVVGKSGPEAIKLTDQRQ